ncbi:uncharacterized protein LOC126317012 [Schistocerca gregaria]|uniref:uncharacterized protein LOC126317012 n=1 Tax=Schistocerca gregaria TaxID=7010 RepID=UPI00211E03BE|nr:uncharacterized protein LOC126317012 [Schistocerca gregaria]
MERAQRGVDEAVESADDGGAVLVVFGEGGDPEGGVEELLEEGVEFEVGFEFGVSGGGDGSDVAVEESDAGAFVDVEEFYFFGEGEFVEVVAEGGAPVAVGEHVLVEGHEFGGGPVFVLLVEELEDGGAVVGFFVGGECGFEGGGGGWFAGFEGGEDAEGGFGGLVRAGGERWGGGGGAVVPLGFWSDPGSEEVVEEVGVLKGGGGVLGGDVLEEVWVWVAGDEEVVDGAEEVDELGGGGVEWVEVEGADDEFGGEFGLAEDFGDGFEVVGVEHEDAEFFE